MIILIIRVLRLKLSNFDSGSCSKQYNALGLVDGNAKVGKCINQKDV